MSEEQKNTKPHLTIVDEAGPIDPVQFAEAAKAFPSNPEIPRLKARSPDGRKAELTPDGGITFSEKFDKALAEFVRVLENDLRDVGKETTYHTVIGPAIGTVFAKVFHSYRPKPADVPFTLAEFIDRAAQMLDMHPLAMADYTVTFMHRVWEQQAAMKSGIVGPDGQPIT